MKLFTTLVVFLAQGYAYDIPPERNFYLDKNYKDQYLNYTVPALKSNPYLETPTTKTERLNPLLDNKPDSEKEGYYEYKQPDERTTDIVPNIRKNLYLDKYPDSKTLKNRYRPLVSEMQDHQVKPDEPDLNLTERQQEPNMPKNPYLSKSPGQISSNLYFNLIHKSDKQDSYLDRQTSSDKRTNPYLNILPRPNRLNPYLLHRKQEPIRNSAYLAKHPDSKTRPKPYLGRQPELDKQNLYLDWRPHPRKLLNSSINTTARLLTKVNPYLDRKSKPEKQDRNLERETDRPTNPYLEIQQQAKERKNFYLNNLPSSSTVSSPEPESDTEERFTTDKGEGPGGDAVRYATEQPVPDIQYLHPSYINITRPVTDITKPQNYRKYDQHSNSNPETYIQTTTTVRPKSERKKKITNSKYLYRTCGIDNSQIDPVYAGSGKVETYPWLGVLNYPVGDKSYSSTAVVLITAQLAIASAMDIHKIPKSNFRELARVVLGSNCSEPGMAVLDYNFHPEYRRSTYSTLALLQLDVTDFTHRRDLKPICGPPKIIEATKLYAFVLPDDCKYSRVEILEMDLVPQNDCEIFYRRNGLSVEKIWPTNVVCGQANVTDKCVWKDGTVLALKQNGRWHLMGLGNNGPGCGSPSRFVDYSAYHPWVTKSVARMGRPSITRLDENEVVLRKTRHIQRFGQCDLEEIKYELYTDTVRIDATNEPTGNNFRYNLTILTDIDYSCVFFKAENFFPMQTIRKPRLEIRSYCSTPWPICVQTGLEKIEFFVEIRFIKTTIFKLAAYGRMRLMFDTKAMMKYTNVKRKKPKIPWKWGDDAYSAEERFN